MTQDECLTGFTAFGATIYPTSLGMAATFRPAADRQGENHALVRIISVLELENHELRTCTGRTGRLVALPPPTTIDQTDHDTTLWNLTGNGCVPSAAAHSR
jgi:hypothetical protein